MKRPSARLLAVTVLATLAGCAIGPDYERPADLPAPVEFRGVLSPQQAESIADLHWTEVFNDPELRAVIETALANNLDLKIAAARVEEFRGRARVARSYLGPNLGVSGSTAPAPGHAGRQHLLARPRPQLGNRPVRPAAPRQRGCPRPVAGDRGLPARRGQCPGRRRRHDVVPPARDRRGNRDHQAHDREPVGVAGPRPFAEAQRRRLGDRGNAGAVATVGHALRNCRRPQLTRVQTENLLRLLLGGEPGPVAPQQPAARASRSRPTSRSGCRRSCWRAGPTCASSRTNCTRPRPTWAWQRPPASRTCRSA